MGNKIQLFGELESVAVDKKLVDAVQVKDSAWMDPDTNSVSEETQSAINAALKKMAENAAKSASDLRIDYNKSKQVIGLYMGDDEESRTLISSFSSVDFTKDGMIDKVIGPITPTWENVTDKSAVGNTPPKEVKWAVNADTGVEAFFALEVPAGYLVIGTVTLGNTYLGFIWNTNTDASKPDGAVYTEKTFKASALDVSTLVDVYTAGDGLKLEGGKFSIKIGEQGEGFLSVDSGSLKLSGVQDAINKVAITHKSKSVSITDANITGSQTLTPDNGNEIDPRSVRAFFRAAGLASSQQRDEIGVAVSTTPAMIDNGVVQQLFSMSVSWSNCPLGTLTIFYDEYSRQ